MKEDLKPARESKVKIPNKSNDSLEEVFAVCLETKIYRIALRGEYVRVIDEYGEVVVYPKSFFLPLQLPSETVNALSTAYFQTV